MAIWTDFLDEVCNSDITITDDFEQQISHIAIAKDGTAANSIDDIGFWGKTARGFANGMIDWIANNHPLGMNQELRDFIGTWRDIPEERNARLGFSPFRSRGLPDSRPGHSANTVCIGGTMPYDCWWFFDEYDLPSMYANTSQAIEGIGGALKLYYDLDKERFTTIKAYTRTKNTPSDTLGNRTFSVDDDKNLTLVSIQLCYEPETPDSANNYSGRFEPEIDAVFDIKDRYHNPEWTAIDESGRKTLIDMRFFEKVGNANTIPTEADRGGFIFTQSVFERSGADLPVPTANTVINNRYRLKPYDSFIQ